MGKDEDKEVVKRLFAAFDAVDSEAMDELLSVDFVAHGLAPQFSEDVVGWKDLAAHWSAGISDEKLTFDDLIAEDGRVAVRWTSRGVHSGEVFGFPATNRRVSLSGIEFYRLANGQVIEYWGELNLSDLSGEHDPVTGP